MVFLSLKMVFGNGNKFRIRRSASKASYLASRRERELNSCPTETGSYKRTMSPGGDSRDPCTRLQPQPQQPTITTTTLIRRVSITETAKPTPPLPDVLPSPPRLITPPRSPGTPPLSPKSSPKPRPLITYTRSQNSASPASSTKSSNSRTSVASSRSSIISNRSPPSPRSPEKFLISSEKISTSPISLPRSHSTSNRTSSSPRSPEKFIISSEKISTSPISLPRSYSSSNRTSTSPRSPEKFIISSQKVSSSPVSLSRSISSPSNSPQPLQLMQRTEVTLRVNATTSDAGCQTEEDCKEIDLAEDKKIMPTRKKLQEEIECERLQQDLAEHLAPSDRLKCILVPGPEHRKPTDYISASGLFKVELTTRCRSTSTNTSSSSTNTPSPPSSPPASSTLSISTTSAYFTTSEPKAKFLISSRDLHVTSTDFSVTSSDLERKKEELVSRLARKLEVLKNEANAVAEESRVNDDLGAEVGKRVARSARPHEAAKFKLHVDEVGQITALLLGLSGRLARAENALMSLDESPSNCDPLERKSLEDKRDKLAAQLTEAKQLKESIDKRSGHVSNMLVQYLNADEYADYDHFINMKAKLIMDARDISDKIKLGEEQLQALKDTLADV